MINISLFLKKGKKEKKYPVSVYQSKQDVEISFSCANFGLYKENYPPFNKWLTSGFWRLIDGPILQFFVNLLSSGKPAEQCSLLTESSILTRQCPA